MESRFATRLTKKDINDYVKDVYCGSIYEVTSPITAENIYDSSGVVNYVYVTFSAVSRLTGEKAKHEVELTDFDSADISHGKFMVDKFGVYYLESFKSFIKNSNSPDYRKENSIALRYLEKYYYDKLFKDEKQRSLMEFFDDEKTK